MSKALDVQAKARSGDSLDKPEPRWQVLLALVAVGGIYTALPSTLSVGPRWLLLAINLVLLAPTIISHRTKRHSLNHALGIINNSVVTIALVGSLALLVAALPQKTEQPTALLLSGATLWLTNVIVFALWYWRLDGGGPTVRAEKFGGESRSFLFPQMQIEKSERAHLDADNFAPGFVDYLFVAFNTSAAFSPTDTPILSAWAKMVSMAQGLISITIVAILVSRAVGVL